MAYKVRTYHEDSDACSAQDFDHRWNLITRRIDDTNNANKSEPLSGVMEHFVFKLTGGWHCSDLFFADRLSSQQDYTSALRGPSVLDLFDFGASGIIKNLRFAFNRGIFCASSDQNVRCSFDHEKTA